MDRSSTLLSSTTSPCPYCGKAVFLPLRGKINTLSLLGRLVAPLRRTEICLTYRQGFRLRSDTTFLSSTKTTYTELLGIGCFSLVKIGCVATVACRNTRQEVGAAEFVWDRRNNNVAAVFAERQYYSECKDCSLQYFIIIYLLLLILIS